MNSFLWEIEARLYIWCSDRWWDVLDSSISLEHPLVDKLASAVDQLITNWHIRRIRRGHKWQVWYFRRYGIPFPLDYIPDEDEYYVE